MKGERITKRLEIELGTKTPPTKNSRDIMDVSPQEILPNNTSVGEMSDRNKLNNKEAHVDKTKETAQGLMDLLDQQIALGVEQRRLAMHKVEVHKLEGELKEAREYEKKEASAAERSTREEEYLSIQIAAKKENIRKLEQERKNGVLRMEDMKKELTQLRERRIPTQGEPPSIIPREVRIHADHSEGRGDSFSSMDQEDAIKERRNAREVRQHHVGRSIDIVEAGPFAWNILQDPLPSTFTPVGFFYDGIGDPLDHLYQFKSIATLHLYTDGIICRVFTTTLVKNAQLWFNSLPRESITSFEDFSTKFLRNFSSSRKQQKTAMVLFRLRQKKGEDLREYVKRFSAEKLEIPVTPPEILVSAFVQGLQDGDFFRSLAKRNASTFAELLERAEKYINLEECRKIKEGERSRDMGNSDKRAGSIVRAPHRSIEQYRANVRSLMEIQEEQSETHYYPGARRSNMFPTSGGPRFKIGDPRFDRYTELTLPKSVILERIAKHPKLRWPRGHGEPPRETAVASGYCHFRNDYGHETNECFTLRDELERLVRLGALSEYVMEENSKRGRDSVKGGEVKKRK